jgi:hypothetical protein
MASQNQTVVPSKQPFPQMAIEGIYLGGGGGGLVVPVVS